MFSKKIALSLIFRRRRFVRKIHHRLLCRSQIRLCFFQGCHHLLNCNDGRVVINRVDLFKTVEAFFNRFNSIQPLQGCLADIISCHEENRRGQLILVGVDHSAASEYDQPQHCSS